MNTECEQLIREITNTGICPNKSHRTSADKQKEEYQNRIDAMNYYAEDIYNPEKERMDHRMTCYAYGLGREVSAGLEYGKNYVLEVIYQVVTADGDYIFLGKDREGSRFRFYYDNETGIKLLPQSESGVGAYNLAGQRVGKDYKGIVISKGKKELRK